MSLTLKIYKFRLYINYFAWQEPEHRRRKVTGISWNGEWLWTRQWIVSYRENIVELIGFGTRNKP